LQSSILLLQHFIHARDFHLAKVSQDAEIISLQWIKIGMDGFGQTIPIKAFISLVWIVLMLC
jgi:hypothetical protein